MAATRHCSLTTPSCCAKLSLKILLTIFIFVQLQGNVSGAIYGSVNWFANNPRFMRGTKDQNCKDDEVLEIRVTVGSKLSFICPTPVMVLDTMQHDVAKEELYENLWIAYDKRDFDTCTVSNTSKYLLSCNNPDILNYFTVYFNIYSASNRLEFPEEKYYYFFSTSDGTVGSLNNTAHGHCNDTKQKVAMKFRLLFCWEASTNPKCNDTDFPYGKFQCVSDKTGTPTSTPSPSLSSPTPTPPVVLPSSHSQPTTPIMATSPVTQVCSTTTVVYTTAVQQAATVTINPTRCQCATTFPVINSTISFNSTIKESSGGPQIALQTGNPDKTELMLCHIFLPVLGCLCVGLICVVIYLLKCGKRDTCFTDMNKVDCFDSKTDKYKNSDAEEGNVIKNGDNDTGYRKSFYGEVQETSRGIQREKSVQGHDNRGYRESISGNTLPRKGDKTEGYGKINEALDAEDGKIKFFQDENTNTQIELSGKGGSRYELTPIGPKSDWKWKNVIYSGEKEVKESPVIENKSPMIENKSPMIENSFPNGTPRSKRVDVRA